jgi:MFS family permease
MPDWLKRRLGVQADVLRLGFVSFLTDLSSEMIFSVFAIFFTTIAGGSSALLGLVEGCADLSASSLNYVAGWLSDRAAKRKVFALAGYGFSTLAKAILLIASSVVVLCIFRVIERLGKGFRGPPRDAWLSAIADQGGRGYSFGVHKALDKAGAVLGPLAAYVLLSWLGESASTFRVLIWVALIPAVLSIVVLGLMKDRPGVRHERENLFEAWKTLSPAFKRYLVAAGIFSLAYFSFGFLLLRAYSVGFSVTDIVLLYALFNVVFVAAASAVGRLGDRIGRTRLIALSYVIYLAMCAGFALAVAKWQIVAMFAVYGVFFSVDEAQSKAFIADLEPERRATAIGVYGLVTGMIYLPASLIAGALWAMHADAVFVVAALLSLAATVAILILRPARAPAMRADDSVVHAGGQPE